MLLLVHASLSVPVDKLLSNKLQPSTQVAVSSRAGDIEFGDMSYFNQTLNAKQRADKLLGRINHELFARAEEESGLLKDHMATLLSCNDLKWKKKFCCGIKVDVGFSKGAPPGHGARAVCAAVDARLAP